VLPAPVRAVPNAPVAVTNFKNFKLSTSLSESAESLTVQVVFSCVFVAAIVKLFASVYVKVILAPLTIFISCVPLPAPLKTFLNIISSVDCCQEFVYMFCVLVFVV